MQNLLQWVKTKHKACEYTTPKGCNLARKITSMVGYSQTKSEWSVLQYEKRKTSLEKMVATELLKLTMETEEGRKERLKKMVANHSAEASP